MDCVVLCTTTDCTELIQLLGEERLSNQIEYHCRANRNYIKINKKKEEKVLEVVARWIVLRFGTKFLMHALSEQCYWLTEDEYCAVKDLALQQFLLMRSNFESAIYHKITQFTEISNRMNIDGLTTFALNELKYSLECMIESIWEKVCCEDEYHGFIGLLQYYMESESSRMKHLTVITNPDGIYDFYDTSDANITEDCMRLFDTEFEKIDEEEPEKQNDILISLLILLIPESITLYGTEYIENKKFINTLMELFDSKIQCYRDVPEKFLNH